MSGGKHDPNQGGVKVGGSRKGAGTRAKRERYKARDQRGRNKKRRAEKDARRAKPLPCGHGSRHLSPYDGECRRCHGSRR